jgi:outer membrane lipoprotein-sorting protein
MRTPLAFLLGKLDFAKDFRDFDIKPQGADYMITAKAKSDKLVYEKIQMLVTTDYQIRRLVIDGQDLSILTFELEGEKLNPPVDEALFKFQMPAGATLDAEGSQ